MKKTGLRVIIVAAAFLALASGCGRETGEGDNGDKPSMRSKLLMGGMEAPPFRLKAFDGREFDLAAHKGSPVVVNFFASWCAPCRAEAPALEKVHREFDGKGVRFVGIAFQDGPEAAKKFVSEYKWTFPAGADKGAQAASEAYRIFGVPQTFIIDKSGRINSIYQGDITEDALREAVKRVL